MFLLVKIIVANLRPFLRKMIVTIVKVIVIVIVVYLSIGAASLPPPLAIYMVRYYSIICILYIKYIEYIYRI